MYLDEHDGMTEHGLRGAAVGGSNLPMVLMKSANSRHISPGTLVSPHFCGVPCQNQNQNCLLVTLSISLYILYHPLARIMHSLHVSEKAAVKMTLLKRHVQMKSFTRTCDQGS